MGGWELEGCQEAQPGPQHPSSQAACSPGSWASLIASVSMGCPPFHLFPALAHVLTWADSDVCFGKDCAERRVRVARAHSSYLCVLGSQKSLVEEEGPPPPPPGELVSGLLSWAQVGAATAGRGQTPDSSPPSLLSASSLRRSQLIVKRERCPGPAPQESKEKQRSCF